MAAGGEAGAADNADTDRKPHEESGAFGPAADGACDRGCEAAVEALPDAEVRGEAVPNTHPVLEVYRSIGEPLDPMSFEELKRRVRAAVERVGFFAARGCLKNLCRIFL